MNPGSVLLLVLSAGLLLMLLTRGRRQQREALALQSRLEPGTEVMTGSGLFATVVEVDSDVVVLETAPGHRSRWDRRAVSRIVSGGADRATAEEGQTAPEEHATPDHRTTHPSETGRRDEDPRDVGSDGTLPPTER